VSIGAALIRCFAECLISQGGMNAKSFARTVKLLPSSVLPVLDDLNQFFLKNKKKV
jgi:hypothetical protein